MGGKRTQRECTHVMHGCSRMAVDPLIPTMLGRSGWLEGGPPRRVAGLDRANFGALDIHRGGL